jgi:hypothetical protein
MMTNRPSSKPLTLKSIPLVNYLVAKVKVPELSPFEEVVLIILFDIEL